MGDHYIGRPEGRHHEARSRPPSRWRARRGRSGGRWSQALEPAVRRARRRWWVKSRVSGCVVLNPTSTVGSSPAGRRRPRRRRPSAPGSRSVASSAARARPARRTPRGQLREGGRARRKRGPPVDRSDPKSERASLTPCSRNGQISPTTHRRTSCRGCGGARPTGPRAPPRRRGRWRGSRRRPRRRASAAPRSTNVVAHRLSHHRRDHEHLRLERHRAFVVPTSEKGTNAELAATAAARRTVGSAPRHGGRGRLDRSPRVVARRA